MGKSITRGDIERLNQLYNELDVLAENESEALKMAKLNKGNIIQVKRSDKTEDITEGQAWEEIRLLGEKADPYKFMSEKYPDVFRMSDEHIKKVKEIDTFTTSTLGVDFRRITIRDIVNLIDTITDMKKTE